MKRIAPFVFIAFAAIGLLGTPSTAFAQALPPCPENQNLRYHNCFGTYTHADGAKYVGEFKDSLNHGQGTLYAANGAVLEQGTFDENGLVRSHHVDDPVAVAAAAPTPQREWALLAEQGDADAQINMGLVYYNGAGVPQDYVYAHMWWNIAASNGNENGGELRDLVAKEMTSSQIQEAQRLARECVRKNYKGC